MHRRQAVPQVQALPAVRVPLRVRAALRRPAVSAPNQAHLQAVPNRVLAHSPQEAPRPAPPLPAARRVNPAQAVRLRSVAYQARAASLLSRLQVKLVVLVLHLATVLSLVLAAYLVRVAILHCPARAQTRARAVSLISQPEAQKKASSQTIATRVKPVKKATRAMVVQIIRSNSHLHRMLCPKRP